MTEESVIEKSLLMRIGTIRRGEKEVNFMLPKNGIRGSS